MEGMWTEATNNKLDEPFSSDRHKLDAENFFDLQVRIMAILYNSAAANIAVQQQIQQCSSKYNSAAANITTQQLISV